MFRFLFLPPLLVGHSIISNVYLPVKAFALLVFYQRTFIDLIVFSISCISTSRILPTQNWWPCEFSSVGVAINIPSTELLQIALPSSFGCFGHPWSHINVSLLCVEIQAQHWPDRLCKMRTGSVRPDRCVKRIRKPVRNKRPYRCVNRKAHYEQSSTVSTCVNPLLGLV